MPHLRNTGLLIGVESPRSSIPIIDPSGALYKMDDDVTGRAPWSRKSKNALVKRHKAHLKTLGDDQNADRPVKQPLLPEAYQASARSIRDLDIVRPPR